MNDSDRAAEKYRQAQKSAANREPPKHYRIKPRGLDPDRERPVKNVIQCKVGEFMETEIRIDRILMLPNLFQTRQTIDDGWVKEYKTSYENGDPMPPVLVYELPDRRQVLVDGFHRVEAAQAAKLKMIKAQIREGTEAEALLAAIAANQAAYHRGRPVEDADRKRAVEMMIRNKETRNWNDSEIARRAGAGTTCVRLARVRLRDNESIPFPNRVIEFSKSQPTERSQLYRKAGTTGLPAIITTPTGLNGIKIGRKFVGLSHDRDEAESMIAEHAKARKQGRSILSTPSVFSRWVNSRGILITSIGLENSVMGGWRIGSSLIVPLSHVDMAAIQRAVGMAVMTASLPIGIKRAILVRAVGDTFDPAASRVVAIASRLGFPIKFLDLEELVAEFGPKQI